MKKWVVLLAMATGAGLGWGKTVGLYTDPGSGGAKSALYPGMVQTIQDAGWQTVTIVGADLAKSEKTDGLDVIFLSGGHNMYNFAGFEARRNMVRFVAGGKGIFAGGCRGGYVRTSNRPIFPQVGATHNRVNGPYIFPTGDSVLAKAIDRPFCPGGWDHMTIKLGPAGKVFAVNGDDPVGVYGEVYGGRYLLFGSFIGAEAGTNAMTGASRRLLLTALDWLASAPKAGEDETAKQQAAADLEFLRREKIWDWTLNERGPDRQPGILPGLRNRKALELQSRQYTLQYLNQFPIRKQLDGFRAAEGELKNAVAELDRNVQKATADIMARIGRMTAAELTAETALFDRAALDEQIMSAARMKEMIALGDRAIEALRPRVDDVKAERLAAERKQDAAAAPALIAKCASDDAAIRLEAVRELGRIGAPNAVPALIKRLADADEAIRIQAVLGLGWMQAKAAVPALIDAVNGRDPAMRRRAAQALGQIGDARAIQTLRARIGDKDTDLALNAILALGWLKAKEAVPELLALVTLQDDLKPADYGNRQVAAIRALGHIGDPAALPTLENVLKNAKDFPEDKKRRRRYTNIYASPEPLGTGVHAGLAIAEIQAGGRSEIGVRQPDYLASRDKFYGLTRSFNALAGRPFTGQSKPSLLWPYLWQAGMTGIHQAWGSPTWDSTNYLESVKAAGELDLRWIDVMPGGTRRDIVKPDTEMVLLAYRDMPAIQGFWSEETYPDLAISGPNFEAWLVEQHGSDYRKKLGLPADTVVTNRSWNTWSDSPGFDPTGRKPYSGPLKMEYLRWGGEKLVSSWRESQEFLHGLRKGCGFTYVVSHAQHFKYFGVTAKAGDVVDANGCETYQGFGRYNSFMMEMYKDGQARPVLSEFYNWYGPSSAHDIRGFAQHLMHGECFYAFHIDHIFEQASHYNMWSWDETRWPNVQAVFQKARKIRDYLAVPESAANVGLLLTDRTMLAFDPVNRYGSPLPLRWDQNQSALWTALNQSHMPTDILWIDTITPAKLARYRVLVLSDAKIVHAQEAETLRAWVAGGGTLIVTGTTSLFDGWAGLRKNYGMAALFGLDYVKDVGVTDPEKNDTFCFDYPSKTCVPAVSGLNPDNFRHHVHREVKPVKSLGLYTVAAASDVLPGIAAGSAVEYDMPLGYDRVKPGAAAVLASFANGDPALTVNRVGKGLCFFWTPAYPALCHVASGWEMQANYHDFWPNVRELLTAMVRGGLSNANATLPVEVDGVSKEIEVTVRQQPEKNRWMVHLLDYDVKSTGVKGATLTVHPPAGTSVKRIHYPDTDTEIAFASAAGGVTAKLRDFEIHDMAVVEF